MFFSAAPALERHRMKHQLFELAQKAGGWNDIHTARIGKGHGEREAPLRPADPWVGSPPGALAGESPVRTSVIPETEKPGAGF